MARFRMARLALPVAVCHLLSTTSAQSTSTPSAALPALSTTLTSSTVTRSGASATPSASNEPRTHTIKVGAAGFQFDPPELKNVSVGDTVTYEFYPPDHSVVQAEYNSACVPYSYADKDHGGKGFWTETQWVNTTADITYYNITINDTAPIFFYCAAPESCIKKLMVGVINPNSTQTFAHQLQAAQRADFQLAVGDAVPKEATSTILNGPTTAPNPPAPSSGAHLSGGAIAGIVVGGVAFLICSAALFFFVGRFKSLKDVLTRQGQSASGPDTFYPPPGPDAFYPPPDQHTPRYGSPAPAYGQYHGAEYPGGWQGSDVRPGHSSMVSQVGGMSAEQLDYYKHSGAQAVPVEMESPELRQQERAELGDGVKVVK